MTAVIQSLVKLAVTAYLLFGAYTLFVGFLEKDRRKKVAGALILIIPTVLIAVLIAVLWHIYGE